MALAAMRGPDGRLISFGGITRKYVDADFSSGALPATVTVPTGTATFNTLPAAVGTPTGSQDLGNLRVTSGTASGNEALIQTQPILHLANYRTVRARVQGLRFDSQNPVAGFYVRLRGTTNIISFGQEYTAAAATVGRYAEGAVTTQINMIAQGTNRASRNHTVEIGIAPAFKEAWVKIGEGDPLVFPVAATIDHNVRFQVGVITREAAAHWLEIATMEMWGEHY